MRRRDDYIPHECARKAMDFVRTFNEDIKIYRQLKSFGLAKPDGEADRFAAYFYMGSYAKHPHALVTLYEAREEIDAAFGNYDAQNVVELITHRMRSYYRLLKENGMIDD